jgi:integrase
VPQSEKLRKTPRRPKRNAGQGSMTQIPGTVKWRLRVLTGEKNEAGNPVQVQRIFTGNMREAEKALEAFRVEVGAVKHGDGPGSETVGHFLRRWVALYPTLPTRRGTLPAPGTVWNYQVAVRDYLDKAPFNAIRLDSLTTRDVNDLIAALQARCPEGTDLIRWNGTVKKALTALSAALTYARKKELIASNPVSDAEQPFYEAEEGYIPTPEEVRAVIAAAQAHPNRSVGDAIILAARTGMRKGEVCALQVKDWDPSTGLLGIRQGVQYDQGTWIIGPPKTAKSKRRISLSPDCVEMLTRRCEGAHANDYIFTEEDGSVPFLKPWRLATGFAAIAKSLGVGTTKIHSLRHFQMQEGVKRGIPISTMAGRLGDDEKTALAVYSRFEPGQDQAAADLIATL